MPELDPIFVPIKGDAAGLEEVKRQLREVERMAQQTRQATGGGGGGAPVQRPNALLDDIFWGPPAGGAGGGAGRGRGNPPPPVEAGRGGGRSAPPPMARNWIDNSAPAAGPTPGFLRVNAQLREPNPTPGFLRVNAEAPGASNPNVGLLQAVRTRAQRELEQAGEKAGEKLGLRAAWVIRSATGGGPLGAVGGGVGALAGLAFGNPAFGALIGNMAGRKAGDVFGMIPGLVGTNNPAALHQFERAAADIRGVLGRGLTPTLEYFTKEIRVAGDALAANEDKVRAAGGLLQDTFRGLMAVTGLDATLKAEAARRPGGSVGAAVSPLQGHVFGSFDALRHAVSQQTMQLLRPEQMSAASSASGASPAVGVLRNGSPVPGAGPYVGPDTPGPGLAERIGGFLAMGFLAPLGMLGKAGAYSGASRLSPAARDALGGAGAAPAPPSLPDLGSPRSYEGVGPGRMFTGEHGGQFFVPQGQLGLHLQERREMREAAGVPVIR